MQAMASGVARWIGAALAATLMLSIAACTGSEEDAGTETTPTTSVDAGDTPDVETPTDPAPMTLSGTPVPSVAAGAQFSFRPLVSGARAGATLTYSIENLPGWASFDTATGEVSGIPATADVGAWEGIVISVSDGERSASLEAFALEVVAASLGSAQLSWTAPMQNADGSPLTDLAGFRVYWGTAADELTYSMQIDNPSVSMFLVENLTPAQWFFAVTALDATGNESALSEVISDLIS